MVCPMTAPKSVCNFFRASHLCLCLHLACSVTPQGRTAAVARPDHIRRGTRWQQLASRCSRWRLCSHGLPLQACPQCWLWLRRALSDRPFRPGPPFVSSDIRRGLRCQVARRRRHPCWLGLRRAWPACCTCVVALEGPSEGEDAGQLLTLKIPPSAPAQAPDVGHHTPGVKQVIGR